MISLSPGREEGLLVHQWQKEDSNQGLAFSHLSARLKMLTCIPRAFVTPSVLRLLGSQLKITHLNERHCHLYKETCTDTD